MITSDELKSNDIIKKCIVLRPNNQLVICCKVLYDTGETLKNTVVCIKKIDNNYSPAKCTDIGYATTNQHGEFCIILESESKVSYKFEIFEPLEKACD